MNIIKPPVSEGEWNVDFDGDHIYIINDEGTLASVGPCSNEHDDEDKANAHAFAATPITLAALELQLRLLHELRTGGYCIDCDHEYEALVNALRSSGYTIEL